MKEKEVSKEKNKIEKRKNYDWLVEFDGISTIAGYCQIFFNTYILNMYDLVRYGLMTYQL